MIVSIRNSANLSAGNSGVVRSAAGHENEPSASLDVWQIVRDAAQHDLPIRQHAAAHRVHHRVGLLEDLLLHERAEAALQIELFMTSS